MHSLWEHQSCRKQRQHHEKVNTYPYFFSHFLSFSFIFHTTKHTDTCLDLTCCCSCCCCCCCCRYGHHRQPKHQSGGGLKAVLGRVSVAVTALLICTVWLLFSSSSVSNGNRSFRYGSKVSGRRVNAKHLNYWNASDVFSVLWCWHVGSVVWKRFSESKI